MGLGVGLALADVVYRFGVDVPLHGGRLLADEARGHPCLSLSQGLIEASARWVVSHRWSDWTSEATWLSLYFSVAVWLSTALVHLPLPTCAAPTTARI